MYVRMDSAEGVALHGLLEETTGDIVIRIDQRGFIETASANIRELGYDLSQLLLKPHLADLAEREYAAGLQAYIAIILSGAAPESASVDWQEFPLARVLAEPRAQSRQPRCWYALSLRAVRDETGAITGALGLLRSVERLKALEGEVYSRALSDPLTGLANRHAFCSGLRRQLADRTQGMLAIFEVDRMRAVFMQYGQATVDEIIWGFATFLETMAQDDHELGQFDAERFCVLLPGLSRPAARHWAQGVLDTFAALTLTTTARSPRLSASAGIAPVHHSVDWTLRQAEVALVLARARGGMQVAESPKPMARAGSVAL
jgi:GGDEF domain-containing protein